MVKKIGKTLKIKHLRCKIWFLKTVLPIILRVGVEVNVGYLRKLKKNAPLLGYIYQKGQMQLGNRAIEWTIIG